MKDKILKYPWSVKEVIFPKAYFKTEDFVWLAIEQWTITNLAKVIGCSNTTVTSRIKKFVELPLGTAAIGLKFLSVLKLKKCSKCSVIKSFKDFHIDSSKKDGIFSKCKTCSCIYSSINSQEYRNRPENKEHKQLYDKQYYIDNKEHKNQLCKENYRKNPEKYKGYSTKRRAAKLQRTPKWANDTKIKEIYKNCPKGHHVDHIIPLQGTIVSGLHVETNLQYLTATENLSKGNKYEI